MKKLHTVAVQEEEERVKAAAEQEAARYAASPEGIAARQKAEDEERWRKAHEAMQEKFKPQARDAALEDLRNHNSPGAFLPAAEQEDRRAAAPLSVADEWGTDDDDERLANKKKRELDKQLMAKRKEKEKREGGRGRSTRADKIEKRRRHRNKNRKRSEYEEGDYAAASAASSTSSSLQVAEVPKDKDAKHVIGSAAVLSQRGVETDDEENRASAPIVPEEEGDYLKTTYNTGGRTEAVEDLKTKRSGHFSHNLALDDHGSEAADAKQQNAGATKQPPNLSPVPLTDKAEHEQMIRAPNYIFEDKNSLVDEGDELRETADEVDGGEESSDDQGDEGDEQEFSSEDDDDFPKNTNGQEIDPSSEEEELQEAEVAEVDDVFDVENEKRTPTAKTGENNKSAAAAAALLFSTSASQKLEFLDDVKVPPPASEGGKSGGFRLTSRAPGTDKSGSEVHALPADEDESENTDTTVIKSRMGKSMTNSVGAEAGGAARSSSSRAETNAAASTYRSSTATSRPAGASLRGSSRAMKMRDVVLASSNVVQAPNANDAALGESSSEGEDEAEEDEQDEQYERLAGAGRSSHTRSFQNDGDRPRHYERFGIALEQDEPAIVDSTSFHLPARSSTGKIATFFVLLVLLGGLLAVYFTDFDLRGSGARLVMRLQALRLRTLAQPALEGDNNNITADEYLPVAESGASPQCAQDGRLVVAGALLDQDGRGQLPASRKVRFARFIAKGISFVRESVCSFAAGGVASAGEEEEGAIVGLLAAAPGGRADTTTSTGAATDGIIDGENSMPRLEVGVPQNHVNGAADVPPETVGAAIGGAAPGTINRSGAAVPAHLLSAVSTSNHRPTGRRFVAGAIPRLNRPRAPGRAANAEPINIRPAATSTSSTNYGGGTGGTFGDDIVLPAGGAAHAHARGGVRFYPRAARGRIAYRNNQHALHDRVNPNRNTRAVPAGSPIAGTQEPAQQNSATSSHNHGRQHNDPPLQQANESRQLRGRVVGSYVNPSAAAAAVQQEQSRRGRFRPQQAPPRRPLVIAERGVHGRQRLVANNNQRLYNATRGATSRSNPSADFQNEAMCTSAAAGDHEDEEDEVARNIAVENNFVTEDDDEDAYDEVEDEENSLLLGVGDERDYLYGYEAGELEDYQYADEEDLVFDAGRDDELQLDLQDDQVNQHWNVGIIGGAGRQNHAPDTAGYENGRGHAAGGRRDEEADGDDQEVEDEFLEEGPDPEQQHQAEGATGVLQRDEQDHERSSGRLDRRAAKNVDRQNRSS
ncbi:unnamed protein product [Amoebophrya sp. A120]|nr:unnamed protein product [Amoebophrya sp. A120]|eukprot:GSA120T00004021001.1